MLRFIVRRLLVLVPVLLGLSIALFAWVRALPGSPAQALLGERATQAQIEMINRQMGLDQPLYEQYLRFLGKVVRLDFGTSVQTSQPVIDEMIRRFPATFELGVTALLIAVVVGVPLGYFAARRNGTWLDSATITGSLIGITIPVFFLAYMLKYVFAVKLGWFPNTGRQEARMLDVEHPTGFYVLDGLVTGNMAAFWDAILHLVLPAIALATIPLAIIARITRAAVLDVLNEDYVRTAESKGLTSGVVTRRHVLRNALLPVTTVIGLQFGLLMSGAILTETVFAFPGVGKFVADAIPTRDYPSLQGFILVIATLFVLINLVVDVAYGLIDPRVRVR
ncbi:ABC transporter permease [Nonomuraea sp. NPDC050663]|uniref:Peptide/nickel transport system permease protein n=1 Tax=Nonomuraea soli TaxID=1032476 RepID=A0A7W0HUG7_9ACTN|nr:ABC transporter permease [Nonomuraea soli]MBA2896080.1 peptide/nickel transport system permease protein [Nonomuraea soli]NUT42660.1 ABC transporter permease [Thermoactinospora sp.]